MGNASKLEMAIRKERVNLINAFKNRESSDSDWYIVKTKYVGLSAELTKETDKISAILQELEQTDATSAISIEEYADIAENTNDFASSSDDLEINSLYNESLPINDEQFIQRSASRVSVKVEPEPEPQPIVKPEPQMSKATQFVTMSQDIQIVSAPALKVQPKSIQSVRPKAVQRKPIVNKSKPKATPIGKRRTVISDTNIAAKDLKSSPDTKITANQSTLRQLYFAARQCSKISDYSKIICAKKVNFHRQ